MTRCTWSSCLLRAWWNWTFQWWTGDRAALFSGFNHRADAYLNRDLFLQSRAHHSAETWKVAYSSVRAPGQLRADPTFITHSKNDLSLGGRRVESSLKFAWIINYRVAICSKLAPQHAYSVTSDPWGRKQLLLHPHRVLKSASQDVQVR